MSLKIKEDSILVLPLYQISLYVSMYFSNFAAVGQVLCCIKQLLLVLCLELFLRKVLQAIFRMVIYC